MSQIKKRLQAGDIHFIHLITDRIKLRRFDVSDLEPLVKYRSKPRVARFQSWIDYSAEDALKLFKEMKRRNPGMEGYWFQFAIEHNESGKMIGDCGLRVTTADPTHADIGFTLDPKFQGQGYATEAVQSLLAYCFKILKLRRITATTDALNLPSARVLERVGMRREASFIENTLFKGKWGSEFQYAMLASEWRALVRLGSKRRSKRSS